MPEQDASYEFDSQEDFNSTVDARITAVISDPAFRPVLMEAMVGAFEDFTGTWHLPRIRTESVTHEGTEVIGENLVPIQELESNDPDDVKDKLNEIIRHGINPMRSGS